MAVFVFTSTHKISAISNYSVDWTDFNLGTLFSQSPVTHSSTDLGWLTSAASISTRIDFLGSGMAPVRSSGKLVDVTAGKLTQIHSVATDTGIVGGVDAAVIGQLGLDAVHFFDLALVKDWKGLATYILHGNDTITGSSVSDVINGGGGADSITGGAGNDSLSGGKGDDVLSGGAGKDILDGGTGFNSLNGGAGADRFVFSSSLSAFGFTSIGDFQHGIDHIALSHSIFTHLGAVGALNAANFHIDLAGSPNGINYDSTSGAVSYAFATSGGGQSSALVAQLDPGLSLSAADFLIF